MSVFFPRGDPHTPFQKLSRLPPRSLILSGSVLFPIRSLERTVCSYPFLRQKDRTE